jgi:hypothetical protein
MEQRRETPVPAVIHHTDKCVITNNEAEQQYETNNMK